MLRKILLVLLGLIALAAAAFFAFAPGILERQMNPVTTPEGGWPVSAQAQALHDRLIIGDWHSDALLWDRNLLKRADRGHTDIPRLQDGNVAVQVFTTVTKSPSGLNYGHNSAGAPDNITKLVMGQLRPIRTWSSLKERALDQAARLHAMADRDPQRSANPAGCPRERRENRRRHPRDRGRPPAGRPDRQPANPIRRRFPADGADAFLRQ